MNDKKPCEILIKIKDRIDAGEPAENVIPFNMICENENDYIEILHFAVQVLPDGDRKEFCKRRLNELCKQAKE